MVFKSFTKSGPFSIILLLLAVYRLTRMGTLEDGPFDVALKTRDFIYEKTEPGSVWQRGIECPYCFSFWVSGVLFFMPWVVVHILGVAGAISLFFDFYFDKIYKA